MAAPFVPLRVFSSYSMLEGAIDPKALADLARKRRFPAIALTDRNGLFAASAFAQGCVAKRIQPIIGALIGVSRQGEGADQPIDSLALLVQDETGWRNLCHLVSIAHLDRPPEQGPHVRVADLAGRTEGLIALTGAGEGALTRLLAANRADAARSAAQELAHLFPGRLYVELARRGDPVETAAEAGLIDLAYTLDLPLVATNPASFAEPEMHQAHDAMLCIAHSSQLESEDRPHSNAQAFVKSGEMMAELFADLPEALANTAVIAQRCAFAPPRRAPILPSLAGDAQGEALMLAQDARAGLAQRLAVMASDGTDAAAYRERLEFELDVITRMGFAGYFLIVADFIKWAKGGGIPVGPGRGSGAGSVVAWALTITDLDPIRLGLLFERFLNPERVSMPDFDIDFCETRRGEVIRYVQNRYGSDKVAQIITFGKMKARAVLRDCGRILQMSYMKVDRLCKMVPNHPTDPWTLARALNGAADFRREYDGDAEVRRLVDLAMQLEGFPRNASTHAAGVVIGDRPLAELVPLYRDPRSDMPVTQFDMKHVEDAGLVKFDFLGLKTLSVLRRALDLLDQRGISIDLDALAWDDPAVFELLQRGDTVGVFQLESEGMRRTLAAVRPTRFEDIIALVSLYRPGPMDNIPLFGRRKNGEAGIEYPHPKLAQILEETYGIFVYQEQVMQAAQLLAGYSLGDADLLRRAMGKKIQSEMDAQRARFVSGCGEVSGIDAREAGVLFDLIDKFAGYGFNKSHAAAYAVLSYQTAWIKTHYPEEFYAASMAFDTHQSDKLAVFVDDMRRKGVALAGPDINVSEADFIVERTEDGLAVRYALAGIRNVGEKAMEAVVAERRAHGEFADLADLFSRIPSGAMNRRQFESLTAAGAFDPLESNRALVTGNAEQLLALAEAEARERASGQAGLFGESGPQEGQAVRLADAEPWSRAQQMAAEREAFGFYFAAHPLEEYRHVAAANGARSHAALMEAGPGGGPGGNQGGGRQGAVMAALVESVSKGRTRKGGEFVRADLSDATGQFSAACFDEGLVERFQDWAAQGTCVLLNVELDAPSPEEPPRITVRGARPLADVTGQARMRLELSVSSRAALMALAAALEPGRAGHGEVMARLVLDDERDALLRLGRDFALSGELVDRLSAVPGISDVTLKPQTRAELRLVA